MLFTVVRSKCANFEMIAWETIHSFSINFEI